MRKTSFALIVVAAAFFTGCQKSSAPPASSASSNDPVQRKLQELAGSGATDCGRFKTQAPAQIKPGSDCALQAAQSRRPFYVAYDMPGLTVGVAGNSEGKMFAVQMEPPGAVQSGAAAEVKSAPCPAQLRMAESGRVTCMTPGSMGMGTSGGTPHGGMMMPPTAGASPHGGMGAPPPGTPNPHTGSKKPPQQ
jgi:hypothetical protein